jgi:hypothetical protein
MSKLDLWERMNAAADRAEDMAKAERILARVRRAPTDPAPVYIDDDGPEIVGPSLGQWIGWPARAPGMGRGR